jgi:hypothetical protein
VELLGRRAEVGQDRKELDLLHRPLAPRRLHEEVVEAGFALGRLGQQEAAAAERAEHGFGHGGGAEGGQRRVEGVAAVLQHLPRGRRGRRVAGGHGALAVSFRCARRHLSGDRVSSRGRMTAPPGPGNAPPRHSKEPDSGYVDKSTAGFTKMSQHRLESIGQYGR